MFSSQFCFTPEVFSKIFPFYIIFNDQQEIVHAGDVIRRISCTELIDSKFEQHFHINRPKINCEIDAIKKHEKSLFLLQMSQNDMQLKGQMICLDDSDLVLFIGSPWVTDTKSLEPLGLKLKDFAIHDPIVDFLFLLQSKNTALSDTKKLADELSKQRSQLQAALQLKENLASIAETQAKKLEQTLKDLQKTQAQLVQTEKMSSLGQLVAGIAHEINNPVNFIHGNIAYIHEYVEDLLKLLGVYQEEYSTPSSRIQEVIEDIDLQFLKDDIIKSLNSVEIGSNRIREIVKSLRVFSRLDEAECKKIDVHDGIDSTLMILQHRLKAKPKHPEIQIVREYSDLPLVACYAGQLNQVFMNIIANAIDALEEMNEKRTNTETQPNPAQLRIKTEVVDSDRIAIRIADNGPGISPGTCSKLFDPFFTTKPVGKGTGLGLSISHQVIVDKHRGRLYCRSELGKGAEFVIEIPIHQPTYDD